MKTHLNHHSKKDSTDSTLCQVYNPHLIKVDPDDCEFMMYTGFYAREDKEICEEDIVEYGWVNNGGWESEVGIIKLDLGGFYFRDRFLQAFVGTPPDRFVILGNTFQNPELVPNEEDRREQDHDREQKDQRTSIRDHHLLG